MKILQVSFKKHFSILHQSFLKRKLEMNPKIINKLASQKILHIQLLFNMMIWKSSNKTLLTVVHFRRFYTAMKNSIRTFAPQSINILTMSMKPQRDATWIAVSPATFWAFRSIGLKYYFIKEIEIFFLFFYKWWSI